MPKRICTKCKKEKNISDFYIDRRNNKPRTACKDCYNKDSNRARQARGTTDKDRDTRFKRVFGISIDDYNEMLRNQDYKCAICGTTESENKKRLAVDHCHTTNKVRKLLCHHCNCALGMVNDDKEILISMLSYLKEFEQ